MYINLKHTYIPKSPLKTPPSSERTLFKPPSMEQETDDFCMTNELTEDIFKNTTIAEEEVDGEDVSLTETDEWTGKKKKWERYSDRKVFPYPEPLTKEKERELLLEYHIKKNSTDAQELKKAMEAREKLILHNMRFVVKLANIFSRPRIDVNDLIQDGYIALCLTIDKYNPNDLENRICTRAKKAIIGRMLNSDSMQPLIKKRANSNSFLKKIEEIQKELIERTNTEPTSNDIAKVFVQKYSRGNHKREKASENSLALSIRSVLNPPQMMSLQSTNAATDKSSLGEHIEDRKTPSPTTLVEGKDLWEKAMLSAGLTQQEKSYLTLLTEGLDGVEIAEKRGCSKQAVNLVIKKARRKIRMSLWGELD